VGQKGEEKMKTLEEIMLARKCRKGPATDITPKGAYWVASMIRLNYRGYDGYNGSMGGDVKEILVIRHFRSGALLAAIKVVNWHQNTGTMVEEIRCDEVLKCTTIEELICTLKCVQNADGENFSVSEAGAENLAAKLIGLPAALPSPDE